MFRYLPDVDQAVIDKLAEAFPGEKFGTREPSPRPTQYTRLFVHEGGTAPTPTQDRFLVTVEEWHKDRESITNQAAARHRVEVMRWGWARGEYLENGGVRAQIRSVTSTTPATLPSEDGWARTTVTYQFTVDH